MSFRYGILCFLLLFIVLMLFFKNYNLWTHPFQILPEKEIIKRVEPKLETPPSITSKKGNENIGASIMIAEKNIFNPERKDFPVIPSPISEQFKKPMVRPKIVLYGVTFAEDYQYALIVTPDKPLKKGEREMMTFKVGDRIGEYQLTKILPDRIIMESGEDKFEVLLYDSKTPKKRIHIKTDSKPATIPSTLSTSAPLPVEVSKPPPKEMGEEPVIRPVEPSNRRLTPPVISSTPPPSPSPLPLPQPRSRPAPIVPTPPPQTEGGERKSP